MNKISSPVETLMKLMTNWKQGLSNNSYMKFYFKSDKLIGDFDGYTKKLLIT